MKFVAAHITNTRSRIHAIYWTKNPAIPHARCGTQVRARDVVGTADGIDCPQCVRLLKGDVRKIDGWYDWETAHHDMAVRYEALRRSTLTLGGDDDG